MSEIRSPLSPYYEDEWATIYHGDCNEMQIVADAVVSDPPYGMGWTNAVRSGRNSNSGPGHRSQRFGEAVRGDDAPFDPTPWLGYEQVILWGANHYTLPKGTTLVWLKRNDDALGSFLSDGELAWQKGGHGVYCFRDVGYKTAEQRFHPTQKPITLMRWCVGRTTGVVLDPFMGSGSTLRAAKDLGRKAIGVEIEERYCEIAARRLSQEVLDFGGAA